MAKVEHRPEDVQVTRKVIREEEFVLTLSADEAKALSAVLNSVGGSPITTWRKYTNSIRAALKQYHNVYSHGMPTGHEIRGSIYFENS